MDYGGGTTKMAA